MTYGRMVVRLITVDCVVMTERCANDVAPKERMLQNGNEHVPSLNADSAQLRGLRVALCALDRGQRRAGAQTSRWLQ